MEVPNLEAVFGPLKLVYKVPEDAKKLIENLDEEIRKAIQEQMLRSTELALCFIRECDIEANVENLVKIVRQGWKPKDLRVEPGYYYWSINIKAPNGVIATLNVAMSVREYDLGRDEWLRYKTICRLVEIISKYKKLEEENRRLREELEQCRSESDP